MRLAPLFGITLLACALVGVTTHARAETELSLRTYGPFLYAEELPTILLLTGEIDINAGFAFRRALNDNPSVEVIALNSSGGVMQTALVIAEETFEREFSTAILSDHQCLSACSLLFFAGRDRFIDGELGVHQFYGGADDAGSAQAFVADLLDALARYGAHPSVIQQLLRTPPDEMYVFSKREVQEWEIARVGPVIGETRTATPAIEDDPPPIQRDLRRPTEDDAIRFVLDLIELDQTQSRTEILRRIDTVYASDVYYYGNLRTRREVYEDKDFYLRRWEERRYAVDRNSVAATCSQSGCTVRGILRWYARSPSRDRVASGRSSFVYRLTSAMPFRVLSEDGEVISRD